jgi:hypothetical protein
MTAGITGSLKHSRIVVHYAGPCCWMWFLHVPTDWFLAEAPIYGHDIIANVARFRGELIFDGFFVEPGFTIDDQCELIEKMMRA